MTYNVSYEVDMRAKFQIMNAQYNGHPMTPPLGWFPLELCNMENLKPEFERVECKIANELTSRIGAVFALSATVLDIVVTWIAVGVIGCIHVAPGPDQTHNLRILGNRIEANVAILVLSIVRFVAGTHLHNVEKKIDNFFAKRMHTNDILPGNSSTDFV